MQKPLKERNAPLKLFSSKPLLPTGPAAAAPEREAQPSPRRETAKRPEPEVDPNPESAPDAAPAPLPGFAPEADRPAAHDAVHTADDDAPPKRRRRRRKKKKRSIFQRLARLIVVLAILFGMYLTAVFSDIPFIVKWRTAYIETAMATLNHKWLATAFIPQSVIDEVMDRLEASRQEQVGKNSQWTRPVTTPRVEVVHRNSTLTDTTGMSDEEIAFFDDFWEVDVPSMLEYVRQYPSVLRNGWARININEAGLDDSGTTIQTVMGEQVLAINAEERILIVRESGTGYRGLLVVAKDPARLSLQASATIGTEGQRAGEIAAAHNGIIGMTGSGFYDEGGVGNGGSIAGYCMCDGKEYGYHMGSGWKRLELHKDDLFYVRDAGDPVSPDVTDAVEFSPAMIIDGEVLIDGSGWGWTDLQPRACIGQSQYGEIIMLLIEGRRPGISIGLGVPECAQLMAQHECVQAMNLDGGTSAMIWYDGEYIMESSNPVMTKGRLLPNGFVYARK